MLQKNPPAPLQKGEDFFQQQNRKGGRIYENRKQYPIEISCFYYDGVISVRCAGRGIVPAGE